jgi:hypothetical protein
MVLRFIARLLAMLVIAALAVAPPALSWIGALAGIRSLRGLAACRII